MFYRLFHLQCRFFIVAIGISIACWFISSSVLAIETARPNVILIMVDDLGYNDLSGFGHPEIKTPVLDQLASEGVRLTNYYAGASVCTPSRMALLTGCYAVRMGWEQGVVGYKMGLRDGLHPVAVTMAEVFQEAGYVTAMSGKWHLGSDPPCRPHRQGFDSAYYIDKSNNQTRQVWRDDEVVETKFVNRHLTEQFTEEAVEFIGENSRHPFFLYLAYTAPHFPVQAHPDWKGTSTFGAYGDVVEEVDARIGQILSTLNVQGIEKNTIVLFCSDNGPQPGQAARAFPFRGMKWSALEGGTRVPCIVRWAGKIPAGRSTEQVVTAMDLFPTLCDLAAINLQDSRGRLQQSSDAQQSMALQHLDGRSVAKVFLGTKTSLPERELLYWHGMGELQAIRRGAWKLFLNRKATVSGLGVDGELPIERREALEVLAQGKGPVLFNLAEHNDELFDYSVQRPDIVKQLSELAERKLDETRQARVPLWQPEN